MLYLLDANVLIDAARDYYPLERVPEFWGWLQHQGRQAAIKIPLEVFEEIASGSDQLSVWLKRDEAKRDLILSEQADPALVSRIVIEGYAGDLTDDEVEKIGRDPFLIAYAAADVTDRSVVTTETSKPNRVRANRHIPDVCATFDIRCVNTFELIRVLGFSTSWRSS